MKERNSFEFHAINSDYNGFTNAENRGLVASGVILALIFSGLLIWKGYNIKCYLVNQQRYKTFSILIFYVLAISDEVFRISMYMGMTLVVLQLPGSALSHQYIYNCCYVITAYIEIMMGFFQAASMVELSIRIRSPHDKNISRWVRIIYIFTSVLNFTAFCMMILLTYEITVVESNGARSCQS